MYDHRYRVSKYDPTSGGDDEWTAFADVGKVFSGTELTLDEYLRVEDLHLTATRLAAEASEVGEVRLRGVEVHGQTPGDVVEDALVSVDRAVELCREMLREGPFWCRLEADGVFYAHVGWDYHIFLGASVDMLPLWQGLIRDGLNVVPDHLSPMFPEDEWERLLREQ